MLMLFFYSFSNFSLFLLLYIIAIKPALNEFMGLGKPVWRATRLAIQKLLSEDEPTLRDNSELQGRALVKQVDATMHLPAQIG